MMFEFNRSYIARWHNSRCCSWSEGIVAVIEPLKMNAILSVVILSVTLIVVNAQNCGWGAPYGGCKLKVCTEIHFHLISDWRLFCWQFLISNTEVRKHLHNSVLIFLVMSLVSAQNIFYKSSFWMVSYSGLGKYKRWDCNEVNDIKANIKILGRKMNPRSCYFDFKNLICFQLCCVDAYFRWFIARST